MMHPEKGVERRHLERRHVSTAANAIVDLIVQILQAAELAGFGVGIPSVVAEGVKVAVRQQQQSDVAA